MSGCSLHRDEPVSVPDSVWHINTEPPKGQDASWDTKGDEKWWDQVDLSKLILASNQLLELSQDICMLPALTVLDVSLDTCGLCLHASCLSSLDENKCGDYLYLYLYFIKQNILRQSAI